ncbi:MAG: hypothetical protein H8E34_01095 [Bacteroidetes bacterium]|nr:hypothetical protein [Bacteroidota bacterium]MBL6944889.1 hypothetical protein [Bacteroidales bacterium]
MITNYSYSQTKNCFSTINYNVDHPGIIRGQLKVVSINRSLFKNDSLFCSDTISIKKDDSIVVKSEELINSLKIESKEFIYLCSDFYMYEIILNYNRKILICSPFEIESIDSFILNTYSETGH